MKFGTNVDPNKKPLEYKFEADIVSKKQSWVMEFTMSVLQLNLKILCSIQKPADLSNLKIS